MAESAAIVACFTFLVSKVDSLLQSGVQLCSGVLEEVAIIRSLMVDMRNYYKTASKRVVMGPELQKFVGNLREVLLRAEDVLEELSRNISNDDEHMCLGSLSSISSSFGNLNAYCQNASRVHNLKSELENIANQLQNYKIDETDQGSSWNPLVETWHESQEQPLPLEEQEIVGFENPTRQLIRWLFQDDSKLKVISISAMGGSGKTTLAQKVYEDPQVKIHFQYHIWLTVSASFKIVDLLKSMIQQIHAQIRQPVPQDAETMNAAKLKGMVNQLLHQSSYILVLDDVWTIADWNRVVQILPQGIGSRVILTTSDIVVANTSSKQFDGHIHKLKPLSPEDSQKLFCRRTFKKDEFPSHLRDVSQRILECCDGLPLAIISISGLLVTKSRSLIEDWETVIGSIRAEMRGDNDQIMTMREILSQSYERLPYILKTCFLYFSIFPEDHPIECRRLTRLWVAERIAEGIEERTAEEVAEGYLKILVQKNLIQVAGRTSDGRVKTCRVHDILHKISILKAADQNFAAIVNQRDAECPETVPRLSIHHTLKNIQQMRIPSQLRSFFMFGPVETLTRSFIRKSFNNSFGMLNVLDLQGAPLEIFPDEIGRLSHLRYLSLRETKVKIVPSSIDNLLKLQTLDLKHSFVNKLPRTIIKLKKLRHLLVYRYEIQPYAHFHYKYGFQVPEKIGNLQSLRTLCFLEADNNMIAELGKLQELRRLGIIKLRSEDGNPLCTSIQQLTKLRALSITAIKEDEIIDLQCLPSPPPFLRRLYLTGRLESLPKWISRAKTLVKLFLKGSQLKTNPFEHLQHLPILVHLELLQVYDGKEATFAAGGFRKLKILGLDKFNMLESINVENGAMPNLEKLIIQRCTLLKEVPSGIKHLKRLKVLEFFDMPEEFTNTLHANQQGEERNKVKHIPEIYSTHRRSDEGWVTLSLGRSGKEESSSDPATVENSHELLYGWK